MNESNGKPLGIRPNASALRSSAYLSAGFFSSSIWLRTYARISSRERSVFLSGVRRASPVIWLTLCNTSSAAASKWTLSILGGWEGGGTVEACCACAAQEPEKHATTKINAHPWRARRLPPKEFMQSG